MTSQLDGTAKLLLALTVGMTMMIGVVIYTVAFAGDSSEGLAPRPTAAASSSATQEPAGPPCDATSVEGASCPPNHYCNFDVCVPLEIPTACGEGESCRECRCAEGLVCHHNVCIDQTRVDRTPLVCEKNKKLAEAVATLAQKCASRKKSVDTIVSSGACTTKDWEELALEDDKFDLLLSAFPNRFAVHFPPGEPNVKRQTWPAPTVREHYLGQIRGFRPALAEAKQIFVIGRSSPDGDAKTNHLLALQRVALVSDLIQTAIYEGMSETERARQRIRIRSFTLASAKPIDPARYLETYLSNPDGATSLDLDPVVTWDMASRRQIRGPLANTAMLEARAGRDWEALFSAINRVVLVIPIPCLGDEYRPEKTDFPKPRVDREAER